jgi:hypothetical protein
LLELKLPGNLPQRPTASLLLNAVGAIDLTEPAMRRISAPFATRGDQYSWLENRRRAKVREVDRYGQTGQEHDVRTMLAS